MWETTRKMILAATLLAVLPAATAGGGGASPQTTAVSVTMTVASSCSINSATNLNFGSYNVLSASSATGSSNISVTCSNGTANSISVALSMGSNSTSFSPRTMKDAGGHTLNYNLFTTSVNTAACTGGVIWGDGTAGTSVVKGTGSGGSTPTVFTVFGCIPAGQDVTAGASETYTDTITVTVTFT